MIEAYLYIEDVLKSSSPIYVDNCPVDCMVNAEVVHSGSNDLRVVDLVFVGQVQLGYKKHQSLVNEADMASRIQLELREKISDIAINTALNTPEKYWQYRQV